MIAPLKNSVYRRLFTAQIVALMGTGLATVALGLLAYELAGDRAGAVLGAALFIKMIAYVTIAPVIGGYADRLPRKAFLIAMDIIRAMIALLLPFVDQVWQVYVLIFLLQSASAGFTPTFQATIPDILPDEREYTEALSLSRLAYDLESLISPVLAAALLSVIGFHWLFAGTSLGFVASAVLVLSVTLPSQRRVVRRDTVLGRVSWGARIYLATPRLRGLLGLNLAAAAGGALVIVNTVVLVRSELGREAGDMALALAVFGGGSMLAALILPRLLDRASDRPVMLAGAALTSGTLFLLGLLQAGVGAFWPVLLAAWFYLGLGYSMILTPSGRLLRRSSNAEDRPALFAAQFALSHACWMLTYPLAGFLGAGLGMAAAMLVLAGLGVLGIFAALRFWPAGQGEVLEHSHTDLPDDHPHLHDHPAVLGRHAHGFVIDANHRRWPDEAGKP